jgi:hypothetical protein
MFSTIFKTIDSIQGKKVHKLQKHSFCSNVFIFIRLNAIASRGVFRMRCLAHERSLMSESVIYFFLNLIYIQTVLENRDNLLLLYVNVTYI